ncbi:MAG: recombinase family protein [Ruminococcus sp.]|nr:recombinase family protein [Ruminococcus sp.]
MKTAAAYIRVSTEDQVEYSPDSQLKAIRKYAKEHDMILPEEYVFMDEGISGRTAGKRPEFQRMIGTAKTTPKPFDTILLWKFSRFARNRQDSIVYKSMLRKQCGIDVVSISEQLGDDNTSVLIEALIEAMDEYYSLNLAEEVKRGMNEKFSRGGVVSQPPFGYKMQDGVFAPDDNADTVRMIFDEFLSGTKYRQIAQKLNGLGIRTKNGNLWGNRNVEYVLTNPVYIGKLRRSEDPKNRSDRFHERAELVDAAHTPIISTEVFEKAMLMRAEIKKQYGKYSRQAPAEFMLKGLCRCSSCGATLVANQGGKYLQCHNYARGQCSVSHCISTKKITAAVIDRLEADLEGGDLTIEVTPNVRKEHTEDIMLRQAIAREEKKLERVREAYEAGVDTLSEYKANKEKIQVRIAELKAKSKPAKVFSKAEQEDRIRGLIESGLDTLLNDCVSETTKNEVLRRFVDRVILMKPKGNIEIRYKGDF